MKIHTDLKLRVIADTTDMPWVPSPVNGIDRKMLERDGDEVARATVILPFCKGRRSRNVTQPWPVAALV